MIDFLQSLYLQIADPWAGSYMMENLTEEIYQAALVVINEVGEYMPLYVLYHCTKCCLRLLYIFHPRHYHT